MQTKTNQFVHSALTGIIDMAKRTHGDDWVKQFTVDGPMHDLLFHHVHLATATSSTPRLTDQRKTTLVRFFDTKKSRMQHSTMEIYGHELPDSLFDEEHLLPIGIEIDVAANTAIHVPGVGPAPIFETTYDKKDSDRLFDELDTWYRETY